MEIKLKWGVKKCDDPVKTRRITAGKEKIVEKERERERQKEGKRVGSWGSLK